MIAVMGHAILIIIVAIVGGGVASLSRFGIGSILASLLAAFVGTKLAVAVISLPHFIGAALRFMLIREHLDRKVLVTFGITSALGALAGALHHVWLRSAVLGYVLGALLVFAGIVGIAGLTDRMCFGRTVGWIAGALSGVFGGLVGNQGASDQSPCWASMFRRNRLLQQQLQSPYWSIFFDCPFT